MCTGCVAPCMCIVRDRQLQSRCFWGAVTLLEVHSSHLACGDEWHATVNARSTPGKETTCRSDQLEMGNVPIILRLSECIRVLELYVLLFKNALELSLEPVLYLTCVRWPLWLHEGPALVSLEKMVPVPGFTHTLPGLSVQPLGWPERELW